MLPVWFQMGNIAQIANKTEDAEEYYSMCLKTDPDFNNKHLRVSAARLYLETMGDLGQKEDLLATAGASQS